MNGGVGTAGFTGDGSEMHRRTSRASGSASGRPDGFRFRLTALVIAILAVFGPPLAAAPAWADGGQSADEGYVMVLQALSFLVNDSGPNGSAQASAMVEDALAAEDQDGVDVATLERARTALEDGDTEKAQTLLQDSIAEAVAELGAAVGDETGTTQMLPPLSAQEGLSTIDWVFLALSVLIAVAGIGLAVLFRPTESLRELHATIAAEAARQRKARA